MSHTLQWVVIALMHVAAASIVWSLSPFIGLAYIALVMLLVWLCRNSLIDEIRCIHPRR